MLDVSLIATLPPFEGMDREAMARLVAQARSFRFEKEKTIFAAGEAAHSFYLLLDGALRVVRITPEGEQVIARYIAAGEIFGIAAAIGRTTYPAHAIAAVDCVVLSWPTAIWADLVAQHPTFASNTYRTVGTRLQEAHDQIVQLATERVEQRVATAILKLARQTGKKTEEGILITVPVTRQDISEMTGTTLHTVSRLMSAWETQGLVASGRQRIVVIEGHKLAMLAAGHGAASG
jgi:CRP-like cAMP-binding protein